MRILFLTNFYPPHERGGQEHSCRQIVEGMKQRGHETAVLTSMHGKNNEAVEENGVCRWLYLEMDLVPWRHSIIFFTQRKKREKENLRRLDYMLQQFQPDVVFVWGMWNLPRSLPAYVEKCLPGKVLYRFAAYWPTLPSQHELYWRTPGHNWLARLIKRGLGAIALSMLANEGPPPSLKFEHTMCVSAATRDKLVKAGVPVAGAQIIHTGLDVKPYLEDVVSHKNGKQHVDLLYAGRLCTDKGVETAVKAMTKLVFDYGFKNIKLSLAGWGTDEYVNQLQAIVAEENLTDYVTFLGLVPSDQMPTLLAKSDVLLVPSIWPEPFARIVLEGMASESVVVATPTGGTSEIVADRENGLLFAPGDADDLAQKVASLVGDPELWQQLANAGRQTVVQRFTADAMLNKIETYLQEIATGC